MPHGQREQVEIGDLAPAVNAVGDDGGPVANRDVIWSERVVRALDKRTHVRDPVAGPELQVGAVACARARGMRGPGRAMR